MNTVTKDLLLADLKDNPEDKNTRLVYADFLEENGDMEGAVRMRETELFLFEELSDKAKEKARDWFREGNLDYDWWEHVYEDAERVAEILGIEFTRRQVPLAGGSFRSEPMIFFQGFYHQRSGSSFSGWYRYNRRCCKKIREYAPQDEKLHSIADRLLDQQKTACYSITAQISPTWRDTSINVSSSCEQGHYSEDSVEQAIQDFNAWIFSQLQKEYDYRNSDEAVEEDINANEYTFDAEGNRDG